MKRILFFSLIVLLAFGVVACGGASNEKTPAETGDTEAGGEVVYDLRFGHSQAEGNPLDNAVKEFARLVEEKTDGRVKVTDYPNMILGDDVAMVESVQMGTLDMMFVPASVVVNFDPSYSTFDVPFLFDNYEHVQKAMGSEFGKQKLASLEKYGLKGLGFWSAGFLKFITRDKGVAELADLKGMIIRCMESAPVMKWLAIYGANPVPMAWSEVPTSIQNGAIHGTMIGPIVGHTAKLSAVAEYYTNNWGVYYQPQVILINKKLFDSMPEDIQKAMIEAVDEATEKFFAEWEALEDEYTQRMVDEEGIILVNSTEEQIAEFIQFTKENVWPLMIKEGYVTQEEIDLIRSFAE